MFDYDFLKSLLIKRLKTIKGNEHTKFDITVKELLNKPNSYTILIIKYKTNKSYAESTIAFYIKNGNYDCTRYPAKMDFSLEMEKMVKEWLEFVKNIDIETCKKNMCRDFVDKIRFELQKKFT